MKQLKITLLFLSFLILTGCAGSLAKQEYNDQKIPDPFETVNRASYAANVAIDLAILRPVATGYKNITPNFVRIGVSNFFSNLSEPRNFLNNLLQLKFERSLQSLARFTFNSTVGLGGVIDIMSLSESIPKQSEDFGQTLAFWGVKPGPYIYLPILGPSTVRDVIGRVGDALTLGPRRIISESSNQTYYTVLNGIETRAGLLALDPVLKRQIDVYNFLRNGYEQSRINSIFDGNAPEIEEDF